MSYGQIYVDLGLATVTPTGGSLPISMPDVAAAALAGGAAGPVQAANAFGLAAGTAMRTIAARAGDNITPADYGATFNGTAVDTAAIVAARAALPSSGGILYYPAGAKINATPSATNGLAIHWYNGATALNTGVVITNTLGGAGNDMYVTANLGRLQMGRAVAAPSNPGLLQLVDTLNNVSGTSGTVSTQLITTTVTGTAHQGGVLTSGVVTYANPTDAGGTFVGFGSAMTKGTSSNGNPFSAWACVFTMKDGNPGPSSVYGPATGLEIDGDVQGADDGGAASGLIPANNGLRNLLFLDGGNGQACRVPNTQIAVGLAINNSGRDTNGVPFTTFGTLNPYSSFKNFIQMTGYASISGLDLSGVLPLAVSGQPTYQAIRIGAAQPIAFDASIISTGRVAGPHTLLFNSTSGRMEFQLNNVMTVGFTDGGGLVTTGLSIDGSTATATIATGGSAAVPANCANYFLKAAASVTSLAITGPPAPTGLASGQLSEVEIINGGPAAISGITWTAGSGASFGGAALPTSLAAGSKVVLVFVQGTGTFFHTTVS